MSEGVVVVGVVLAGWAWLRALGLDRWGALALAGVFGPFLVVVIGLALVVSTVPTSATLLWLPLLASAAIAVALSRRRFTGGDLVAAAVLATLTGGLVALTWSAHLLSYHIDSFGYLTVSGLLATGTYDAEVTQNLATKRMLLAPALHALSDLYGASYVRSVTPLMTVSLLASTLWFASRAHRAGARRTRLLAVAAALLAVAAMASTNRFVWNAFYVNAHLAVGIAIAVVAGAAWVASIAPSDDRRALLALIMAGSLAVIVGRPEGFILAGLALAPFVLAAGVAVRDRRVAWATYALGVVAWYGSTALRVPEAGATVTAPALIGVLALLATPLVGSALLGRCRPGVVLASVHALLWLALAALAMRSPDLLRESLNATYENVVGGAGSWGSALVGLALLTVLALALARDPALRPLRFPLLAAVPVVFLLVYMRGMAYRVGDGDSLNRMLIQFVPLVALHLAAVLGPAVAVRVDASAEAGGGA